MGGESLLAIYLVGGTTEANLAAVRLREEGYHVTVSVATSLGCQAAGAPGDIDVGRKDALHLANRAAELGAAAVVDCSHPFASLVSQEARNAAAACGLPYLRYCRAPLELDPAPAAKADSWAEAVEMLKDRPGRALLTVGIRNLELFVSGGIDFTARVLPTPEALRECGRLGIEPRHLIAAHPPFSVKFNRTCIRHAGADILVTKESGEEGGLREKAEAAAAEGIDLMVISRPHDPAAIHDLEELVTKLKEAIRP